MSLTIKTGDTFPYLRGSASDKAGLLDLSTAAKLTVVIKGPAKTIEGAAEAIHPAEIDEEGVERNWQYKWAEGDTAEAGTYEVELRVTWSEATTPHEVETFPNSGTAELMIVAAQ